MDRQSVSRLPSASGFLFYGSEPRNGVFRFRFLEGNLDVLADFNVVRVDVDDVRHDSRSFRQFHVRQHVRIRIAILPFFASIRGVDETTIEASKDLGAGPIRTFFSVTVPQTYGGLLSGTVLVAIPTFGAFLTPSLLGGPGQMMIGVVIDIYFNQSFDWNFAAAVGTLITAFIMLVIVLGAVLGGNVLSSRTPGDEARVSPPKPTIRRPRLFDRSVTWQSATSNTTRVRSEGD